jgi:hypothetical protein
MNPRRFHVNAISLAMLLRQLRCFRFLLLCTFLGGRNLLVAVSACLGCCLYDLKLQKAYILIVINGKNEQIEDVNPQQ